MNALPVLACWIAGCASIAGGWAFGTWQSRHELATGRYTRDQILSAQSSATSRPSALTADHNGKHDDVTRGLQGEPDDTSE